MEKSTEFTCYKPKEVIYVSRLERAVASSGNYAFSIAFESGFPAEILSESNPFSDSNKVIMGEIVHPDDYQPFCEIINEIVSGRSDELKAHARIRTADGYRWFYISAAAERSEDKVLREILGMMFDVTEYLDCDCDDAVLKMYRRKSDDSLASAREEISISDILGSDYLSRIQKPFAGIKGLYSAIAQSNGSVVAVPAGQDKRINLNKMDFQRKKSIIVNHNEIASWIIAGDTQEAVDDNSQLLNVMVETVSGIANSYVVLGGAMEDSQNANRLLGQNFEDSILINNVYSIILESTDTRSAIGRIIPLITGYFGLADMLYCYDEVKPAVMYRWDKSGMMIPVVRNAIDTEEIKRELDYNAVVIYDEKTLGCNVGQNRSCALTRTYRGGKRSGLIVFIAKDNDKNWTNRDRKQLRSLTQILSTVIFKAFVEDEITEFQERLHKLAYYDLTTNIPNRSMFEKDFQRTVGNGGSGAVIALEITNMKSISEIFSCEYADNILKSSAEYIEAIPCGSEKRVYRFSNDILFIVLKDSSRDEARQFAQALLTKFSSPWFLDENEHHLEIYAGVTIYPVDADNLSDVVRAATQTLRLAKERKYCDAACYSEGLEEQLNDNRQVKKLIMDSAENDFRGFYFLYQPVLNINTGALHCCEATLFWGNGDMIISKERFLPIIDRMGLSASLHCFVMNKVCEFCAQVRESVEHFRVSIAIPESILSTDMCIESLRSSLLEYSLPPNALSISISESEGTMNPKNVVLKQLSKIGVNIIAEDIGDRFFTTERIENDIVKTIKIRSSRFTGDQVSGTFLRSLINRAHEKGITVCVRGVDNANTFEQIRKFDVDLVEGIFNGRPLHTEEFIEKMLPNEPVRKF